MRRCFYLPKQHVFRVGIFPLVDGLFKCLSWLILAGGLKVAALLTGSRELWALHFLAYAGVLLFLFFFFGWLLEASRKEDPAPQPRPAGWRLLPFLALSIGSSGLTIWLTEAGVRAAVDHAAHK